MNFLFSRIEFDRFEHKPITYYLGEGGNETALVVGLVAIVIVYMYFKK